MLDAFTLSRSVNVVLVWSQVEEEEEETYEIMEIKV